MKAILHSENQKRLLHLADTEQVQHKITIPQKVFTGLENKWAKPESVEINLVYRFTNQIGEYYHYQLE